jgi:hypothetical protein
MGLQDKWKAARERDRQEREADEARWRRSSLGCRMQPREGELSSGYLAGRKATWIWTATPGALKPSTSLVL